MTDHNYDVMKKDTKDTEGWKANLKKDIGQLLAGHVQLHISLFVLPKLFFVCGKLNNRGDNQNYGNQT